jgi:hypothetical protein
MCVCLQIVWCADSVKSLRKSGPQDASLRPPVRRRVLYPFGQALGLGRLMWRRYRGLSVLTASGPRNQLSPLFIGVFRDPYTGAPLYFTSHANAFALA